MNLTAILFGLCLIFLFLIIVLFLYCAIVLDKYDNNQALKEEIKKLKRQILIKDKWCYLIWAIGCDYDGYNDVKNLKDVIDELVDYSNKAVVCDDTSVCYIGEKDGREIKENILMEEIE